MEKKTRKKRSIFTRLVISYLLFLMGTLVLFLAVTIIGIIYMGNGSLENASPQNVIKSDGSLNDIEVLRRIGGWVEELDENGNVIEVTGEKKTDRYSYDTEALAIYLDLGYVSYSNGITFSEYDNEAKNGYTALIRYAGEPRRAFLVFYPANMVTHTISYLITNSKDNNLWKWLIIFDVLFVLEVTVISLYLKKRIDRPLKLLMKGMDEVSQGKRDVVIDYSTDREFEDIRDRFNCMAQRLAESEKERHNIEQSRNRLLLELAHDIKNPAASIKSSICALQEGLVTDEKIEDYYKTIRMKTERICTLTDDINTNLKMESDDYEISPEKTDICELVRLICVEFYEDITTSGKEFEIDIPDTEVFAALDVKLFRRVISNLLGNANTYNVTGHLIAVRLYQKPGKVVIDVSDDGEHIAEDFVPRLFDAFSRGDATRKTDGGTGLGLSIAKKIVEKHGGRLEYRIKYGRNCFSIILDEI